MMPIRDVVIFPYMMTPFVVGRESSVHALEEALAADKKIFLATQHDASIDEPKANEIYQVGTIVNIVQSLKLPDGNIKVLVEGLERGKIQQVVDEQGYLRAIVKTCFLSQSFVMPEAPTRDHATRLNMVSGRVYCSKGGSQGLYQVSSPFPGYCWTIKMFGIPI